jgi:hypothetical protein
VRHVRKSHRAALGGCRPEQTWGRLNLSCTEAFAAAVVLVASEGWNRSVVHRTRIPGHDRAAGDDVDIYMVELDKRRRPVRQRYTTSNLLDAGPGSPGRLMSQVIEATELTRRSLDLQGRRTDRLLAWRRAHSPAGNDLFGTKRRRQKTAEILASISLLWGFAPHLPSGDRIPMPPWESGGLRDYLPADEAKNENTTPPIHPAVMSPLLIWALRFVEDFADDILAAWEERQRLIGQIPDHPDPDAARRLRALIEQHITQNRPLPGGLYPGQLFAARTYLAAITGATEQQTKVALRDHGRGLPVSSQTPLGTAIRGQLHGRPWKPHVNSNEAPVLMRRLAAAAMILVIYLSGMRPGEALNLRAGCCPEPADDGSSSVRHEIRGNFHKGARGEDGKIVPGGLPRETPWTVILPVVHAIRILERMTDGHLLCPVKTAWAKATPGNRKRPGEALHCQGAQHRIEAFTSWVNEFAAQQDLTPSASPATLTGPSSSSASAASRWRPSTGTAHLHRDRRLLRPGTPGPAAGAGRGDRPGDGRLPRRHRRPDRAWGGSLRTRGQPHDQSGQGRRSPVRGHVPHPQASGRAARRTPVQRLRQP